MDKEPLVEQLRTSVKGIEDIIAALEKDSRPIDYIISDIEEELVALKSALATAQKTLCW